MTSWTDWHTAQVAAGMDFGRAEIESFAGVHFVLHSTGDVSAMYPFNRAKLKGENPEQFATQAAVARAKREAMDYTDDRVSTLRLGLGESPFAYPLTMYEVRLSKENTALAKECDFLRIANDHLAKTIGEMQEAAKRQAKELADIREGREKAVARCVDLEKANRYLRAILGANL